VFLTCVIEENGEQLNNTFKIRESVILIIDIEGTLITFYNNFLLCFYIIFFSSDFSLTQWFADTGYPVVTTLTGKGLTDLLEDLDIISYLESSSCNRTAAPYSPTDVSGWNNGIHCVIIY